MHNDKTNLFSRFVTNTKDGPFYFGDCCCFGFGDTTVLTTIVDTRLIQNCVNRLNTFLCNTNLYHRVENDSTMIQLFIKFFANTLMHVHLCMQAPH